MSGDLVLVGRQNAMLVDGRSGEDVPGADLETPPAGCAAGSSPPRWPSGGPRFDVAISDRYVALRTNGVSIHRLG